MSRLQRISYRVPSTISLLVWMIVFTSVSAFAEESNSVPVSFPTTDKWMAKDYQEAVLFITQTAKIHPENLPRADGEDGRFDTLIKNLNGVIEIMDITDREDWKELYKEESQAYQYFTNKILMPIFAAYGVPKDMFNLVYEREILIMLPLVIESIGSSIKSLRLVSEDWIDDNPATGPEGFQEKFTEFTRLSGTVTNAIISVIVRPGDRHPDLRSKIIADCQESMQHLLWAMNEADRNRANMTLEILKETLEEPSEYIAIDKLIQCERQSILDEAIEPERK
jgi:hypothetical protein